MANVSRRWAGHVFGTNTGNLFADFDVKPDGAVTGTIRIMDAVFGLTIFKVTGTFDSKLQLTGEPIQASPGVEVGTLEVNAVLTPDGSLRGDWKTSHGTAGTFTAFPHDFPEGASGTQHGGTTPEQVYTSTARLGALRLYGRDVLRLLQFIKKDFLSARPVVTYRVRGTEVSKYAEQFIKELSTLGELRYLKVNIQEPEAHGINKMIVVELSAEGQNEVRTQGIHETWVVGTAEGIARILRESEKFLWTTFRKFGLGLNQIIFLAMLILLPEITSLEYRTGFVALVVLLLIGLLMIHRNLIPSVLIYSKTQPTTVQRFLPSLVSWLATVASAILAAFVFYWITGSTS